MKGWKIAISLIKNAHFQKAENSRGLKTVGFLIRVY